MALATVPVVREGGRRRHCPPAIAGASGLGPGIAPA